MKIRKTIFCTLTALVATLMVAHAHAQVQTVVSDDSAASSSQAGTSVAGPISTSACDTNCLTNLGDCGRPGRLFNRGGCGCGDTACGGQCGGCDSGCMGGGVSGILDKVKSVFRVPCGGYRSFFGGWSDVHDYNGTGAAPLNGTFNDGFVLGWARGRYLNPCTRLELEGSWRNNSGEFWNNGTVQNQFDGHFNNYHSMLNLVRELGNHRIKPYIGGGIGVARQDGEFTVMGNRYDFDEWAFAYQGLAGINFKQSEKVDVFCEYRYLGNSNTELEENGVPLPDEFQYLSESIVFGFRIRR